MLTAWQKQDPIKRRLTLPNELFSLELSSNEISVYAYLLYCENRKAHQCRPSYNAVIGTASTLANSVTSGIFELSVAR